MNDRDEAFPTWLEATMRTRGMSQAQLARTMGVGETQVSRWRRGLAVPTVHSLHRLAATLGVPRATLDQLAGYPTTVGRDLAAEDPESGKPVGQLRAYQAILGDLMEQRVPRELWHVYVEGCSALADALSRSFNGMLERAGLEPPSPSGKPTDLPNQRLGFREPSHRQTEASGENHGNSDRR